MNGLSGSIHFCLGTSLTQTCLVYVFAEHFFAHIIKGDCERFRPGLSHLHC